MDVDYSLKDVGVSNNSGLVFLDNTMEKDKRWNLNQFHYHEVYEVLICIEAKNITCFAGNQVFDVQRGSVFVFSPYMLHRTSTDRNSEYRRLVIYFNVNEMLEFSRYSTQILSMFIKPCSHAVLGENELNEIIRVFNGELSIDNSEFMKVVKRRLKLFRIMLYLSEKINNDGNNNYSKYSDINKMLDYVRDNISDPELTLKSVASNFYRSTTSVNSLFKRYLNTTLKEYIIMRRISIAQELLRNNSSVSDVCEKVGFNNYSHFIRTFTREVGVSPKQYSINIRRENGFKS